VGSEKEGFTTGDTATVYATAELSYDSHSLGSGDTLTISGYGFTWDSGNNRFQIEVTKGIMGSITFGTLTSGTEATFSITEGTMTNDITLIWSLPPSGSGVDGDGGSDTEWPEAPEEPPDLFHLSQPPPDEW
jgi:hypothetical protein